MGNQQENELVFFIFVLRDKGYLFNKASGESAEKAVQPDDVAVIRPGHDNGKEDARSFCRLNVCCGDAVCRVPLRSRSTQCAVSYI